MNKKEIKTLVKVLRSAGRLKRLKRTGWVLKKIEDAEHVSDHTWRVILMTSLLADDSLDKQRLLEMAIVHDLGEIKVGDIRWEAGKKILAPEMPKRKREEKAVAEIFMGHPRAKYYVSLLKEFTDQKTPESRFLKQVDKLERTLQAFEYEQAGNKNLDEFWDSGEKYLEGQSLEPIFRELQKMRKNGQFEAR
jgi:putative hydrolase of HD superfamily